MTASPASTPLATKNEPSYSVDWMLGTILPNPPSTASSEFGGNVTIASMSPRCKARLSSLKLWMLTNFESLFRFRPWAAIAVTMLTYWVEPRTDPIRLPRRSVQPLMPLSLRATNTEPFALMPETKRARSFWVARMDATLL